jgi:tRNA(Ile2) C34 agmatinyltransferase TiaS
MTDVQTEIQDLPLCRKCGNFPVRSAGQRYCKDCHREANKEYRAHQKRRIEILKQEIELLKNRAAPA